MNAYRVYRRIIDNPMYPEQNGTLVFIQDYGDLDPKRCWRDDCLGTTVFDAEFCRTWYADYGVKCEHWVAIYKGWTVEYVKVDCYADDYGENPTPLHVKLLTERLCQVEREQYEARRRGHGPNIMKGYDHTIQGLTWKIERACRINPDLQEEYGRNVQHIGA
jgi:hypothetical protein